jgi:hypothetical protein
MPILSYLHPLFQAETCQVSSQALNRAPSAKPCRPAARLHTRGIPGNRECKVIWVHESTCQGADHIGSHRIGSPG